MLLWIDLTQPEEKKQKLFSNQLVDKMFQFKKCIFVFSYRDDTLTVFAVFKHQTEFLKRYLIIHNMSIFKEFLNFQGKSEFITNCLHNVILRDKPSSVEVTTKSRKSIDLKQKQKQKQKTFIYQYFINF